MKRKATYKNTTEERALKHHSLQTRINFTLVSGLKNRANYISLVNVYSMLKS